VLVVFCVAEETPAGEKSPQTNVVLIITDNQGAWTLGCYGNPDIQTPHIDQMAREGIRFTRAFSSNAVCSPTRATVLTGLIPSQHGVHSYLRKQPIQMGPDAYCVISEFPTLPKILAQRGYRCGLVGKWHLGNNLKPQIGFTDWITMPHGATSTFYDAEVIENGQVRREPTYLTELWTQHAVSFIEQNRQRPFFLFLSYNGPYGLGNLLLRPSRNQHQTFYADKRLPSFPRGEMHPWLYNNKKYFNNINAIRRYAAEASAVDDGVGRVLAALKKNGLDEQTLVLFLADQGWAGGQHGIWGMGDHTRPIHAFDSTMHIPLIFRHPGSIPPQQTSDRLVANYDLLPTLLGYLGNENPRTTIGNSPGRDFSKILLGRTIEWDDVAYYEYENTRAIRTAAWKYVHRVPSGPHELYRLTDDPGEQFNLYGQPTCEAIQTSLRQRLEKFFDRYADPQYDLWRGGRSKPLLLLNNKHRLTLDKNESGDHG